MTNYYTQFSAILTLKNDRERKWVMGRYSELRDIEDEDSGGTMADFDGSITSTDAGGVASGFWIRDNGDYGNLEQVANFVQEFLKKFRPKGCFSMEWAHICDKHRTDGFGGGAVFVTAKAQKWLSTFAWLSDREKKFGKKT